jgi:hypothetical protein
MNSSSIWFFRFIGVLVAITAITMLIAMWAGWGMPVSVIDWIACIGTHALMSFLGACGVWLAFNAHQL